MTVKKTHKNQPPPPADKKAKVEYSIFMKSDGRKVTFTGFNRKELDYIKKQINNPYGHGISLRRFMDKIFSI